MSSAFTGAIRTGGDRGLFEYATALINVNESAGKRGAGNGAARAEIILSEKERGALQANAALQDRREGLVDLLELSPRRARSLPS